MTGPTLIRKGWNVSDQERKHIPFGFKLRGSIQDIFRFGPSPIPRPKVWSGPLD